MRQYQQTESKSLVSVVVPCYNQAHYLPETLDSVMKQTYQNWECIIVNDGSPDNTDEVAKKYCLNDSRFKYIYKKNGGLSSARNAGIIASSGVYILPLDSDDRIGSEYLSLAIDVIEANEKIKIVYCREKLFGMKNIENILSPYSIELMLCRNLIFCSALFRREDYDKTSGYNENMKFGFEDWDFWLSLLETGGEVHQIDKILFYYRIRRGSMAASMGIEQQGIMRHQIWSNHKELYATYFLDPIECFEYKIISRSLEYRIGCKLLEFIRCIQKWLQKI